MMKTKMAYLSQNQDVISHNIANIDTPGFKPRQLKELDFRKLAFIESRRLEMRATAASHQAGTKVSAGEFRDEKQRKTYETTPVENAVVLEEQMLKITHNQLQYQTLTNLYKKTSDMFKTAIGNA